MTEKLHITWEEYHNMVRDMREILCDKIFPAGDIHLIGVQRGGLLLAALLSYLSDRFKVIRSGEIINIDVCDGHPMRQTVVVDDILDTGKTRAQFGTLFPFAVLIDKSPVTGIPPANIAVKQLKEKQWVVFPYECEADPRELESMKVRGYA